jgi:hypothetical protein
MQPELRDDVGRGRGRGHAAAAHQGGRDAGARRVARADPLPRQHRASRRPHLRQLLLQGRRDRGQPPGTLRALHGRLPGARPVRVRVRVGPRTGGEGDRPRRPRGAGALARPRGVLPGPEQGPDRLHRRPHPPRGRPHVQPAAHARPHARPARRPRAGGRGRLHRRHDLLGLPDLAHDVERGPVDRLARADPGARRGPDRPGARTGRPALVRRDPARPPARVEGRRCGRHRQGLDARGDDRARELQGRLRAGGRRPGLHARVHPEPQRGVALRQVLRAGAGAGALPRKAAAPPVPPDGRRFVSRRSRRETLPGPSRPDHPTGGTR